MRPQTTFYTTQQTEGLMARHSCDQPLPKKGERVMICFARTGEAYQADLIEIERTNRRSDSGARLWGITQSSREGREFEAVVQESHVVAYLNATRLTDRAIRIAARAAASAREAELI